MLRSWAHSHLVLLGSPGKISHRDVLDSNDYINVEAFADQGGGLEGVSTSVFGEVLAASTSSADGVMLDVKGYGDINVNEVVRFRQLRLLKFLAHKLLYLPLMMMQMSTLKFSGQQINKT